MVEVNITSDIWTNINSYPILCVAKIEAVSRSQDKGWGD